MTARRALSGLLSFFAIVLGGCGSDVSVARMGGIFPARPPTCELELRTGTLDQATIAAFDTVGVVSVSGDEGEAPNSARVLGLLKAEACKLGGEVVLVNTSANLTNGFHTNSHHSFLVLRKKGPQGPANQKF